MPSSRLLGSVAAAAALGVDVSTLWRWRARGVVHAAGRTTGGGVRRGHLRWDVDAVRAELQALVDQGRAGYAVRRAAESGRR